MNLSIGHRVFLVAVFAIGLVSVIGIGLVRWAMFNAGASHADTLHESLAPLEHEIAGRFSEHRGWSFLPDREPARSEWLRLEVRRCLPDAPPSLAYRVALLDPSGRVLAGTVPHPATVAFASIDTVRTPITVKGTRVAVLLRLKPSPADDGIATAFLVTHERDLLLVLASGIFLAALSAALLAWNLRGSLRRLVDAIGALEAGRFEVALDLDRGDELGVLSRAFDRMARRLAEAQAMRRRWIAETSHELRTPLAVLRGQIESLQDGIRPSTPQHLALMARQVQALTRRVEDLHVLAIADEGRLSIHGERVDVRAIVRDVFADFEARFRAAGLDARMDGEEAPACARGDRDRIAQIMVNLFENCVRYTTRGGCVAVRVDRGEREVCIVVEDSAPDVPEPQRARLGERAGRAAVPAGSPGSGLGLAISRMLAEAQGARIAFTGSSLGGLRVIVGIPSEDVA